MSWCLPHLAEAEFLHDLAREYMPLTVLGGGGGQGTVAGPEGSAVLSVLLYLTTPGSQAAFVSLGSPEFAVFPRDPGWRLESPLA